MNAVIEVTAADAAVEMISVVVSVVRSAYHNVVSLTHTAVTSILRLISFGSTSRSAVSPDNSNFGGKAAA
jgi:hypothetical protein